MRDSGAAMNGDESALSTYRELAPPPALAGRFICLWVQQIGAGAGPYSHRVLPDACADIVWIGERAPVLAGPATHSVTVELPAGSIILGARLHPGFAASILGFPALEAQDQEIPLGDLGPGWKRLFDGLSDRPAPQRLAFVEAGLARRLAQCPATDRLVVAAVDWLARHPAGRVRELSRRLEISPRQLQRRFSAGVGYGPKTFQRVLRFQRALSLAHQGSGAGLDLASLAAESGYADQAHMTREVQALGGGAPSALFARAGTTLAMSDFFKTASAHRT
jgi:AraC-like DNA-binding protein